MLEPLGCHIYQTFPTVLRFCFRCFFKRILLMPFKRCFCMFCTHVPFLCFGAVVFLARVSNVLQSVCVTVFQICSLLVFPVFKRSCVMPFGALFLHVVQVFQTLGLHIFQTISSTRLHRFAIMRSELFPTHFCDALEALVLYVWHTFCFEAVPTCWFLLTALSNVLQVVCLADTWLKR